MVARSKKTSRQQSAPSLTNNASRDSQDASNVARGRSITSMLFSQKSKFASLSRSFSTASAPSINDDDVEDPTGGSQVDKGHTKDESDGNESDESHQREKEECKRMLKTKHLLFSLNNAISDQANRIEKIDQMCDIFDHTDRLMHDKELRVGAANVLFQKLSFAVLLEKHRSLEENEVEDQPRTSDGSVDQTKVEIAMLCCALEFVYRANHGAVRESFGEIGKCMLPVLVGILHQRSIILVKGAFNQHQSYPHDECRDEQEAEDGDEHRGVLSESYDHIIVRSVVKILRNFAKAGSATDREYMIQKKGLRSALIELIKWPKSNENGNDFQFRPDALALFGFLAEEESIDNKLTLLNHSGLLDTVLIVARTDRNEKARKQASFALMNLVNVPKICLSNKQRKKVLDALVALIRDVSPSVRRFAGATIFNLAYSDQYDVQLAQHQGGAILEAMKCIISSDSSCKSRSNAAWVLFYLSSSRSSEVAEILCGHPGIPMALALAACDDESMVKVPAAKTLRKLSEEVNSAMPCHGALLEALVRAAEGPKHEHEHETS